MKALILAAGYATRLYPLTKEYPKSLLKIDKRPLIDYIIDKLNNLENMDEVIVVTNSKFIAQFRKWKQKSQSKKNISLVDDLTCDNISRLGAIGDMHFALNKKRIRDDLLVIGGDNLFDGSLKDFLNFTQAHKFHPVIGVYNIKDINKAKKYGVVKLDTKFKVIDFAEKPKHPKSTLVAMCLYYFPREKLGLIKEYLNFKETKSDATGFYIDWLRKKEEIFGFMFNGRWYDIGDYQFYREAKEEFVKEEVLNA